MKLSKVVLAAVLTGGVLGAALSSCGGGSTSPPAGASCVVASDCKNPLSCSFGLCHEACRESRDCPTGSRCVIDDGGNKVCQLPQVSQCVYNSDCPRPLVCAIDRQCRNQCQTNVDCVSLQTCVMPDNVCADTRELDSSGKLILPDAGARPGGPDGGDDAGMDTAGSLGDAGAGGAGGTAPGTGGGPGTGGAMSGADAGSATDGASSADAGSFVEDIAVDRAITRQGDSGIRVTVRGNNLGNPREATLGDLTVTPLAGATPTMFQLRVVVPHGAALGPKDLRVVTDGGIVARASLLTVTAITAGPSGRDTARGTSDDPFRTLTRAIEVADAGDTIQLLDGVYSEANGENWTMTTLPANTTLLGQGQMTRLLGPAADGATANVDGLRFQGDAVVKNLEVGFFANNIDVRTAGAKISLENVSAPGARSYALYVQSSAVGAEVTTTGMRTAFRDCGSYCIYVLAPDAKLSLFGGGIVNARSPSTQGIYLWGMGVTASIGGFELKNQVYAASGVASLTLSGVTIELPADSTRACIWSGARSLSITDATITNGYYGLEMQSGSARVRNTSFDGYQLYGVYLRAGVLDLGTGADPGNNRFVGPNQGGRYAIYDDRGFAMTPITVSDTTFNGFLPPAGEVVGPQNVAGRYYIRTANNIIRFE